MPLKLVDVDSNAIVPSSSPRFAGQFVIDDQTALDLVFSSNIDAGKGLTVLHTPYGLDDIRWATTPGGTLYLVDHGAATNTPATSGLSTLYKVTGPFVPGVAYASSDSIPDEVVTVNLASGKITPFIRHLQTAKGLVYLDASGSVPVLPLSSYGASATPVSNSSGGATPTASVTNQSTDGDGLPIALAIVAIVLAVGFGAYSLRRRSPAP
ncbi:MAG TPA: hypothetical protein VG294_11695 [Solirubrobacteraceae bacterium]|nr:hypothetical protein [Solirubrobacteraceae bacterium]